jgi:hypothetical protein
MAPAAVTENSNPSPPLSQALSHDGPDRAPSTTRIGIATKMRKKVVNRLSSRSG